MKVSVDKKPGSVVNLDIAAEDEEFSKALDRAYRKISQQANIPGFRKGKAPRHIVERMVGREAVVEQAGMDMMDDLYRRALDERDIRPISEPEVDIYENEPIKFRVEVEVFPEVELGDYRSVRVESREVELEGDEVDETLEEIRKNFAEWVEPELPRSPADGDQVIIDLEVYEGGEQFQEPGQDEQFVLGESSLFEPIVEAIKMLQPGATSELTLAFEEDDETVRPEIRGKTLRYVITLKDVKQRKLPDLDEEFAAQVGEFETMEELRAEAEKDILRNKAQQARSEVVNEIMNAVAETSTVEVPKTLISSQIDDEINQMRSRLAQQQLRLEDYLAMNNQTMEDFREEMEPSAEQRVRNTLVMQEVAKAEDLEVTDEDIDAEITRMTAGAPDPERMRELYQSDYFRGMLQNELHDRKITDFLVEMATEGQGAITGAGAKVLEEDEAPPAPEADEAVTESESAEDEVDTTTTVEAQGEVTASEPTEADDEAKAESGDQGEEESKETS